MTYPTLTYLPQVTLIAKTEPTSLGKIGMRGFYLRAGADQPRDDNPGIAEVMEFAGRKCYDADGRKNPATATAEGYLGNIMDQNHESVLEHSSFTFWFQDISRACSHEVVRHRHLSFSQESQRFVLSTDKRTAVVPPATYRSLSQDDRRAVMIGSPKHLTQEGKGRLNHLFDGWDAYDVEYQLLRDAGLGRKQASEAARAFIPNAAATEMVVTGNARSWKEFIQKRLTDGADAEIRVLAEYVLMDLEEALPEIFGPEAREHWSNDSEQKGMK